jgi:hypothetical protein
MSTAPAAPVAAASTAEKEIRIISHSNLFYWWPVWAIGFIMALLTLIDGHRMAILPGPPSANKPGTEQFRNATVIVDTGSSKEIKLKDRDVLVLQENKHLQPDQPEGDKKELPEPNALRFHVAQGKSYAVIFCTVLVLVIVITNVPLRGMWSVVIIMLVIMLVIIFSLAGWWDTILGWLFVLHIHINLAGYLFISIGLLAIWLVAFFFFDQQIYMIFTPRQFKVRTEIGGGEVTYDTIGMSLQKQRSDLFRHWILGLGSGDLVVNTSGAQAHHFDLPNVLFVGKKVQQIEDMMREIPQAPGH